MVEANFLDFANEARKTRFRSGVSVLISFAFHAGLLSIIALSNSLTNSLTHRMLNPLGNSMTEATTISFVPLLEQTRTQAKRTAAPSMPTEKMKTREKIMPTPVASKSDLAVVSKQTQPLPKTATSPPATPNSNASAVESVAGSQSASTRSTKLGTLDGSAQAGELGEYLFELRRAIDKKKVYPSLSRRMGEAGKVLITLEVLRDGTLQDVKVKSSSRFERLDRAALDTVAGLESHRPLPPSVTGDRVRVEVPIEFSL